jgi:haloacetate dehalogenase
MAVSTKAKVQPAMELSQFTRHQIDTDGARIHALVAGEGPPLLLLHGFPQSSLMWRDVAPALAKRFTVVCADLRGYGESSRPASDASHAAYSKRAMARDQAQVMEALGFQRFHLAGHDRGGRVAHRLGLDYPDRVERLAVLDIVPTHQVYTSADRVMATAYYHWFFLIQPAPLPERLIEAAAEFYLREKLARWLVRPEAIAPDVMQTYVEQFLRPGTIHAMCEDYRAGASIDLQHDEADLDRKLRCPLLVLWGSQGFVGRYYDVLSSWRARAENVSGTAIDDAGHLLVEEQPAAVTEQLLRFFG